MDRANGVRPGALPSRAERFEDEKRRIIDSCFSRKDPDGSLQETYITHIRITEFSSHPAAPPPPQARTPDSEKPRVIIIAVRKSGRVRMHKSKENSNGTFSVGKTWNIDDLTHIESFTGPQVGANNREWAGDTGFTVTLGKPYFWQAQTDKEKKFFIASMIKIFGKYTSGRMPELSGFDQKELDQVMGAGKRPATNGPPPPRPAPPEFTQSQQSNLSAMGPQPGSEIPARLTKASPVRTPASGNGSPAGSFDSTASRDRLGLRNASMNNKSQDSLTYRSEDTSSLPPRSRNGLPGPGAFGRFGDPREMSEPPTTPLPQPPTRAPNQGLPGQLAPPRPAPDEQPPERRRPPMDPGRPQDRNLVPAPLMSPVNKQEPVSIPPPRSSERLSPRKLSAGQRPGVGVVPLGAALKEGDQPPPAVLTPGNALPGRIPKFGEAAPPTALTPGVVQISPRAPKDREPSAPPSALRPGSRSESSPAPPPTIRKVSSAASIPRADPATSRNVATPPPPMPVNASSPAPAQPLPVTPPAPAPAEEPDLSSPPPEAPAEPKADEEEARPGLGPMIKSKKSKGELANTFRKAAAAASAFKPRPGGAGERLRLAANKANEGPDGITSVVPAPPRPEPEKRETTPEPPPRAPDRTSNIPQVKVSVPESGRPLSNGPETAAIGKSSDPAITAREAAAKEAAAKEARRRSVRAGNDAKYLQSLGVDSTVLDGRSDEFSKWLDFFGWVPGDQMRTKTIDDMKNELDRELNKAQAGGWLARFQEEDERVDAIKNGIDVAITECEELDNLLTLYSVELSTLSDDIAFIEAQGQGLQVQTANQKLLKKELESLLETCAITSNDLEILRIAPLDNFRGLEDVETSLVMLFKAMIKIDPTLGGVQDKAGETMDTDRMNSDYSNMRIVQEKKEMYVQESSQFMRRLMECMAQQFDDSFAETKRALEGALSKKVDASHHETGRDMLWRYSPLMLYARDVDLDNWNRIIQIYQDKAHPVYKNEFGTVITSWRRNARKMGGEEAELLFTHQVEKQQEGVAMAARKLTVKRSQTLARALRSPLADGGQKQVDKTSGDRSFPYEVFAGVLDDLLPLVEMEQNFVIDFFHATTLEQLDFPDAVGAARPRDRRGGDLKRHRLMEPDRDLARRVTRSMEVIFSFFEQELTRLIEWVLAQYPLQGIGVLAILEKKMADISQSNLDYLNALFQKLHSLLSGKFRKFVDEQIRAIEETKVKINKRKGVISFIRVFSGFSTAVENMVAGVDPTLAVRRTIDREYDRILKTMFDSLKVIARENPAVTVSGAATADPEDKEALNFHILLIENMNHFVEETDARGLEILEEWKETANQEYHEHMGLYLNAVMRRPLGKLLDHLENIEAQLQMGKSPSAIAAQPSNSKMIFNKILGGYDSKEVRKGIEALRKRVEKHFGDADDPALSKELVAKVTKECEKFFIDVESRIGRVTTDVYGGDVLFEWPRADVKAAFR